MNEISPILISGFYRSGTTLLRKIIDSHSRIYCGPQIKFFSNFTGSELQDPLARNRLFRTLRDHPLSETTMLDIWGNALIKTFEHLCAQQGKKRWADKNPDNIIFIDLWAQLLGEDFKVIYMIRHPIDTLASLQEIGFAATAPQDLTTQIQWLNDHNQRALNFKLAHPHQIHIVRYEDLVSAPEPTIRAVVEFLNETYEPSMLNEWKHESRGIGIEDPKIMFENTIHTDSIGRGIGMLLPAEIETINHSTLSVVNDLAAQTHLTRYIPIPFGAR